MKIIKLELCPKWQLDNELLDKIQELKLHLTMVNELGSLLDDDESAIRSIINYAYESMRIRQQEGM